MVQRRVQHRLKGKNSDLLYGNIHLWCKINREIVNYLETQRKWKVDNTYYDGTCSRKRYTTYIDSGTKVKLPYIWIFTLPTFSQTIDYQYL